MLDFNEDGVFFNIILKIPLKRSKIFSFSLKFQYS